MGTDADDLHNKAYESVAEDYHELHDKLKHKPEFCLKRRNALARRDNTPKRVRVLERAKRLSGDR